MKDTDFGGGFVSDCDRVYLQSLLFASPDSRSAASSCLGGPANPGAALGASSLLARTLSTPRSSVDTNQVRWRGGVPRGAAFRIQMHR